MGLSFSAQISKDITNGYLAVINQLTANATTSLNDTKLTVNTLNISACDLKSCGRPCTVAGINANQGNQVTLQLSVQTLQDVVTTVKTKIADATTQYVKQANTDQQAWLAIAFGINIQDQTTINNFSEKISNLISNNVSTICASQLISSNNATLILCNVTGSVNVTQRNDVLAAESCVSKQIVTNIVNNQELFNGMQAADQASTFSPSGPFSFLYYFGIFILFIIIVVTIAGVIRYATRGPKKTPLTPIAPVVNPPVMAPIQ
jgi:hypothetical protein